MDSVATPVTLLPARPPFVAAGDGAKSDRTTNAFCGPQEAVDYESMLPLEPSSKATSEPPALSVDHRRSPPHIDLSRRSLAEEPIPVKLPDHVQQALSSVVRQVVTSVAITDVEKELDRLSTLLPQPRSPLTAAPLLAPTSSTTPDTPRSKSKPSPVPSTPRSGKGATIVIEAGLPMNIAIPLTPRQEKPVVQIPALTVTRPTPQKAESVGLSWAPMETDQLQPLQLEASTSSGASSNCAVALTAELPARQRKRPVRYKDYDEHGMSTASEMSYSEASGPPSPKRRKTKSPTASSSTKSEVQRTSGTEPIEPIIQQKRCLTMVKSVRWCVSCIQRRTGDVCRFRWVRSFPAGGTQRHPVGPGVLADDVQPAVVPIYPTSWNIPMMPEHRITVLYTVSKFLVLVLEKELVRTAREGIFFRNVDLTCRIGCDFCNTSMFDCGWLCSACGREYCDDCREQIVDLTNNHSSEEQVKRRRKARYVLNTDRVQRRLMYCTDKEEHYTRHLTPITRFKGDELQETITKMKSILDTHFPPIPPGPPVIPAIPPAYPRRDPSDPEDASGLHSLPFHTFTNDEITDPIFKSLWSDGKTMVITGVDSRLKFDWSPNGMIERYGSMTCTLVDCDTEEETLDAYVGEFFEQFGRYDDQRPRLKLKDWPPTSEFSVAFPDLFKDFSEALPVPNYTRRDGVLNVASHFPLNEGAVNPDIGPKMYNAFASTEAPGTKGTTRLHMDMADAVNVMMHATPKKDGSPGTAVWDIYPSADSAKIRGWLINKFSILPGEDSIHSQHFYLDAELRKELFDATGAQSWRIYQKAGEAVFIPAGCAHQVCNLSDCIKVAVDFVSPENIDRCQVLTEEFRALNLNTKTAWKDDVLQLKQTQFHAFCSLQREGIFE